MKDFENKLNQFDKSNPFAIFYDYGLSKEDIKEAIIESFSPYFQNVEILKENATTHITNTWLGYLTIHRDSRKSVKYIKTVLDIFNDAKNANHELAIEAYSYWFPELTQSISRFWSLYNNQPNTQNLDIEDFTEEVLAIIGQSIEGLSKPFLKLLLHLNRIKRNKPVTGKEIQTKDLGLVIDELINTTNLNEFLIVGPNLIKLNQWRNIAYHHNSKIIKGKIHCFYKKNGQSQEFTISRKGLDKVAKHILLIFKVIRISETIFGLDNITEITKQLNKHQDPAINIREECYFLDFYSAISSQGFKVVSLKYDKALAKLVLKDIEEYSDFSMKAIHSSQFLYNLWLFTESSKMIIDYHLFNGERYLTSEIEAKNIKKVSKRASLLELLRDVKFSYITAKYTQSINPFEELTLSKEIRQPPQEFYSQAGDKISVEEFIRQFSLSVFANYLVLTSEGLKNIKINVGVNGSASLSELPKKIILHVPATIKSKPLQLKLIETISNILKLYETGDLKREIVEEAKCKNRYYIKKTAIKDQLKTNQEAGLSS